MKYAVDIEPMLALNVTTPFVQHNLSAKKLNLIKSPKPTLTGAYFICPVSALGTLVYFKQRCQPQEFKKRETFIAINLNLTNLHIGKVFSYHFASLEH